MANSRILDALKILRSRKDLFLSGKIIGAVTFKLVFKPSNFFQLTHTVLRLDYTNNYTYYAISTQA